jgi:adenylate cyclase
VAVQPVERKLSAIFAADIAGYSRLMSQDEVGTLARLKACRVIIDGLIATHRGRIFNTAGDSVIADFASAVDAVACAVAVQNAIATQNPSDAEGEPMRFRIESSGETEIRSEMIGELVMEALASLDQVAYIRFASVYRNFREAKDFGEFVGQITADDD